MNLGPMTGRFKEERLCTVPGCSKACRSRGLCKSHYKTWNRARAAGRTTYFEPLPPETLSLQTRLARRLYKIDCVTGCWLSSADDQRYCAMTGLEGKSSSAHRLAWELYRGPIPAGLVLDHLCRRPACFNPDHLEAVPNKVNVLRGVGACAQNARKETCSKGHLLLGLNLRVTKEGFRECLACYNALLVGRKLYRRLVTMECIIMKFLAA